MRLVTGDRVRLSRLSDGRSTAALLPGSPSLHRSVEQVSLGGHVYVIPAWMKPRDRRRLDMSMFDVTRLAAAGRGGVPVSVRFVAGTRPHDLPGIRVDATTARRGPAGPVAQGTYLPGQVRSVTSGLRRSWRDVSDVRLHGEGTTSHVRGYQLHTLTIDMVNRSGGPVRFGDVFVQNVDDGRLFAAGVFVTDGEAKVSVPDGHYAVLAMPLSFRLLINPEFSVRADKTVTLHTAAATARVGVRVPRAGVDELSFTATRTAEKYGGIIWEMGTYGGGSIRVQPVIRPVRHGSLTSAVGAHLTRQPTPHKKVPVDTKQGFDGIPADLSFAYQRTDFTVIHNRFHANDRPSTMYRYAFGMFPTDFFASASGFPVHSPSQQSAWLLARPGLRWSQSVDAWFSFSPFRLASQSSPARSYPAGPVGRAVEWFRGPVGPGIERRLGARGVGPYCLLCRAGDRLRGNLPMWSSAGTDLAGFVAGKSTSEWSLSTGRHRIASGAGFIAPRVTLPGTEQSYRLEASVRPDGPAWSLSTRVSDTWTFRSGTGTYQVPLVMPSYVPPTDLSGDASPGRVHYGLRFGHLGGSGGRIVSAALSYSTDQGRTWHAARLARTGQRSFRVSYVQPGGRRPQDVTLRVRGTDAAGRSVDEVAVRAYSVDAATAAPARTASRGPGRNARPACNTRSDTRYRCFALVRAGGRQALTRSGQPAGYGAPDLQDAYGVTSQQSGSTLAVVVSYHYPSAAADLAVYRKQYGLPPCTASSGCFTTLNQAGQPGPYPSRDHGWALEAALDLQMASAACPQCRLLLVEANQPTTGSLNKAVDAAAAAGAAVTNHSYGITEYGGVVKANAHYDHPGVTAVAASGDYGYQPASFPASSPQVVAVGGTALHRAANGRGWTERAWRGSGSGCSAYFAKPSWQHDRACHMRTFGDVSAVAAPGTGVAVYDSFGLFGHRGWFVVGGTSAASPFVAGMIAAAGAGGLRPGDLYDTTRRFHDVRRGANGYCRNSYICSAKTGYDGPTGWGTPRRPGSFG